jgi:hypothetical protein
MFRPLPCKAESPLTSLAPTRRFCGLSTLKTSTRLQTAKGIQLLLKNIDELTLRQRYRIASIEITGFSCIRSDAYFERAVNSTSSKTLLARATISKQTSLNTRSAQPFLASSINSLQASNQTLLKQSTSAETRRSGPLTFMTQKS